MGHTFNAGTRGRSRQFEASLVQTVRSRPGKVKCYTVRFYLRKKEKKHLFVTIISIPKYHSSPESQLTLPGYILSHDSF